MFAIHAWSYFHTSLSLGSAYLVLPMLFAKRFYDFFLSSRRWWWGYNLSLSGAWQLRSDLVWSPGHWTCQCWQRNRADEQELRAAGVFVIFWFNASFGPIFGSVPKGEKTDSFKWLIVAPSSQPSSVLHEAFSLCRFERQTHRDALFLDCTEGSVAMDFMCVAEGASPYRA